MACRTPVIATPAGAAPDLVTEENGFLLTSFTSKALLEKIHDLVMLSPDEWGLMSQKALSTALQNDWSIAASRFESMLLEVVGEKK